MSFLRRLGLYSGLGITFVAAGCWIAFGWVFLAAEGDGGEPIGHCLQLISALRRNDELERQLHLIARGEQSKRQICQQLTAGEMTLVEAAARFRAIEEGWPEPCKVKLQSYAGFGEEERRCRYVIAFVKSIHEERGQPVDELLMRLHAELQRWLVTKEDVPHFLELRD